MFFLLFDVALFYYFHTEMLCVGYGNRQCRPTLLEQKVPNDTKNGAKSMSGRRHPRWCQTAPSGQGAILLKKPAKLYNFFAASLILRMLANSGFQSSILLYCMYSFCIYCSDSVCCVTLYCV